MLKIRSGSQSWICVVVLVAALSGCASSDNGASSIATLTTPTGIGPTKMVDACGKVATTFAQELGAIQSYYSVATTAAEADIWRDNIQDTGLAQPNRWESLPGDQAVEICLVVGSLTNLNPPGPPGTSDVSTFAAIGVTAGAATLEFSGYEYDELPAHPLPGMSRAAIAPYSVPSASASVTKLQ